MQNVGAHQGIVCDTNSFNNPVFINPPLQIAIHVQNKLELPILVRFQVFYDMLPFRRFTLTFKQLSDVISHDNIANAPVNNIKSDA